jgi:prevent-host-death family protein
MNHVYSTQEAQARFGEILLKVRTGEHVVVSYQGQEVAEIRPIEKAGPLERRLRRLEAEGTVASTGDSRGKLRSLKRRPGALKRFLESRD